MPIYDIIYIHFTIFYAAKQKSYYEINKNINFDSNST